MNIINISSFLSRILIFTITVIVLSCSGSDLPLLLSQIDHNSAGELYSMETSQGQLHPEFNRQKKSYTLEVPYRVSFITVKAIARDSGNRIFINGMILMNDMSPYIPVRCSANPRVVVDVVKEEMILKTYSIIVTRKNAPSPNLIYNHSFEIINGDEPRGWEVLTGNSSLKSAVDPPGSEGSRSAYFTEIDREGMEIYSNPFEVTAGCPLEIYGDFRSAETMNNIQCIIGIHYYSEPTGGSDSLITTHITGYSFLHINNGWETLSLYIPSGMIPDDALSARICIGIRQSTVAGIQNSAPVFIDNIIAAHPAN